jgi:hypothetical protein
MTEMKRPGRGLDHRGRNPLLQLLEPDVSLERAWAEIIIAHVRDRAAVSTVEALMLSLRSSVRALGHADTLRRLAALGDAQLREIAVRVQRFKPHIAPAWTSEEVEVLIAVRSRINGR